MKYEQRLALITDPVFTKKIRYALISAAADVIGDDKSTADQIGWAWTVMQGGLTPGQITLGATLCAADDVIADAGSGADDALIQAVINRARSKFIEIAPTKREV